jgi:dipeptidyl aminopeptidase
MHQGPSDHAEQSSSAEMRQKSTVNPFVARPATYYGDGPFDPPSSDDDGEGAEGSRHSFEDDAESVLLLNLDKSGPSSPGTAERGDQNPRPTDAKEKVRQWCLAYSFSLAHDVSLQFIDYRSIPQSAFLLSRLFLWLLSLLLLA